MSTIRHLASIMFTDIVGYTRLMGNDEDRAFEILKENRSIQRPLIEQNHGKLIKELGDGLMISFNSVSDSVNAAIQIQEACAKSGNFQLRIGIHLGDVVFENDDVFGDGVNIASRIQSIAQPGTIYISESVYQNISNKPGFETRYVKQELLKNVKDPIRIYEVVTDFIPSDEPIVLKEKIQRKSETSIAVLPMLNLSNDPEQDYLCDGISEEIINSLGQLKNLRVVARSSAFSFKGKNVVAKEIGKALDVTTLLEGSVRKSGNRLRIITQLVRVSDSSYLWSNRYDRELEDIFAIQDDIATNVATTMKGYLTNEEKEVIKRPETIVQAYEHYLKGNQFLHQLLLSEAVENFEKAIALDSEYAMAYAGLAHVHAWQYEWYGGGPEDLRKAEFNSSKAISLQPNMAESHSSRGYVLALGRKYDEAEKEFKKAIELNSNSYDAYYFYARSSFSRGQIELSAELFRKASEVRKEDFQSLLLLGQSMRKLGKNGSDEIVAEGLNRARKVLGLNPSDRRALSLASVSLFISGEHEEAKEWINRALKLYPNDPGVLINAACLFSKAKDKEKALSILESAFQQGYGNVPWISNDPDFDILRDEPRFKALLKR